MIQYVRSAALTPKEYVAKNGQEQFENFIEDMNLKIIETIKT